MDAKQNSIRTRQIKKVDFMHNTLNSQQKATRICKSKSLLLIIACCILPFILIFTGFNTPSSSQYIFWQTYQNHMVITGLTSLLLSYWMILFRPDFVIKLVVKEKVRN
jgi:hypothetical protein